MGRKATPAEEAAAVWVTLDALDPWKDNPRHNAAAVDEVVGSIRRFGFGAPIIARKADGMIIAGHTRYEAAKKLGLERVPVRYLDLDPADARLLALADNKLGELAEWDDARLSAVLVELRDVFEVPLDVLEESGFSKEEVASLLADNGFGFGGGDGAGALNRGSEVEDDLFVLRDAGAVEVVPESDLPREDRRDVRRFRLVAEVDPRDLGTAALEAEGWRFEAPPAGAYVEVRTVVPGAEGGVEEVLGSVDYVAAHPMRPSETLSRRSAWTFVDEAGERRHGGWPWRVAPTPFRPATREEVLEARGRIPESYVYDDLGSPDFLDDVVVVVADGTEDEALGALEVLVDVVDTDSLRIVRGSLPDRVRASREALVSDAIGRAVELGNARTRDLV